MTTGPRAALHGGFDALRSDEPWSEIFAVASALVERHGWGTLVSDLLAPAGRSGSMRPLEPLLAKVREVPRDIWLEALTPVALLASGVAATARGRTRGD